MSQHETEYLIKDNKIIARETFTRSVADVESILKQMRDVETYSFSSVKLPPLLSKWVKGHYLGCVQDSDIQLLLTEVEYFPLTGAHTSPSGKLYFERIESKTPVDPKNARFNFGSKERMFIIQSAKTQPIKIYSPFADVSKPLHFILKDQKPFVPRYLNTYSNGDICTGSSYKDRTKRLDLYQAFKVGLDCLHEARPNYDLNSSYSTYMHMDMSDPMNPKPKDVGEYQSTSLLAEATKSIIIQTAQWINNRNL